MKKYVLTLMILAISIVAEAGIVVCHNNGEVINFRLRGNQEHGCLWFDAGQGVTQGEYDRVAGLLKNTKRTYLKVFNGIVEEKTLTEKQQADADEALAINAIKLQEVNKFNVSNEDIITALIQTINKRLPTNKINKQEIIDTIKINNGL